MKVTTFVNSTVGSTGISCPGDYAGTGGGLA